MDFNRILFWRVLVTIAIAALSANAVVAEIEIVTDGLVSFWSLDRSSISGDDVRDLWGNNHGTMEGKPEIVDGKINEALLFDGSESIVEVEHSASLDLVDAITMEFWFMLKGNSVENNFPRPLSKGQSTVSNGAYGIWINDTSPNDIGFRCITLAPNDIRSQALPNYDDGNWHHVVVTYDGKSGKLYFDGENHVDIAVSGDISQTDEPLHIGDGNNERHFNGVIDEVRIYKKALDGNEVLKNYNVESNSLALSAKSRLADFWGRIKVH